MRCGVGKHGALRGSGAAHKCRTFCPEVFHNPDTISIRRYAPTKFWRRPLFEAVDAIVGLVARSVQKCAVCFASKDLPCFGLLLWVCRIMQSKTLRKPRFSSLKMPRISFSKLFVMRERQRPNKENDVFSMFSRFYEFRSGPRFCPDSPGFQWRIYNWYARRDVPTQFAGLCRVMQ